MIVLSLLSLLAAAPADRAAALGDTVVILPEVRVSRTREGEARRRLPTASVSEIEAGASGRALETVADLLAEAPGVRVQQYGGLGAFSTVSVRGAPPGQVSIFLDGTPLTAASHGVVSLADLPSTAIERVEVYRGSSPLDLGPAGAAGAINLVTVSTPELRQARLSRGAFGTWEGRASAGARRGAFSGLVHAGFERSRGDFSYPDDNGTPFNLADDSLSARLNNRFSAGTLLASASWRPGPRWRVGARADRFAKAQGVPGLGAVPALGTHLGFARALERLDAERRGGGAAPGVRIAATLARERTRFRDLGSELGLGRHDTDDRAGASSLALDLDWRALPHALAAGAGAAVRGEWARPSDRADGLPDPPESRRLTAGGTASLQWRPWNGRLIVHGAMRLDRLRDRLRWLELGGTPVSRDVRRTLRAPQLGVRWAGPGGLALRANASRASRAPDFLELFGNQGSVIGNPALAPERTANADLGAGWSHALPRGASVALDLAHFESRAEDLVVYVRHSQSSVRAENISRARMRGEELSLRLAVRPGLAASGGLTWLAARDRGPVPYWQGRRLPLRPALQAFARVDWTRGRLRATGDLQYIGDDYLDRANLQPVPDRWLAGASLTFDPRFAGLRVTLEGKNLGNDRVADVGGFPLPGRALFAACELDLGPSTRSPR